MTLDIPSLEPYCKPEFENTQSVLKTRIDDKASSENNFIVCFDGNDAHFVPLARPILQSFICNIKEEEFKSHRSKQT